ncbi:hypothetical protein CR513_17764, partial [Mucuna pruriens]
MNRYSFKLKTRESADQIDIIVGQHQPAMAATLCGICTSVEYPTNMCPTLQETESDQLENVGAIGNRRIKIGLLIVNNMEDSHFGRDRIKGLMQLNNSGTHRIHIRDKQQYTIPVERDRHHPRPQNVDQTSARSSNLPSQTIPNSRGNGSVVTLKSVKELPQPTLQQSPRSAETDFEPNADSQSWPEKTVPAPFPTRTISTRRLKLNEELLKMF